MTLVVAATEGKRIGIVADTLLSQNDKDFRPQDGVIKSCLLPGGLCVSFCNSAESAAIWFDRFRRELPDGARLSDVVDFFCRSSRETSNDYILAFAKRRS